MKLYNIKNDNTLDALSLHDRPKLDSATYYDISENQVIADAELPFISDNQVYLVSGERNTDGNYTISANVSVVADYRGQIAYKKETQEQVKITDVGEIDEFLTLLVPTTKYDNFINDEWVLTTEGRKKQLDDAKKAKRKQVDAWRDSARYADVKYDGSIFQTDQNSQLLVTSSVSLYSAAGGTPEGFTWRDANNVNHDFDLRKLIELGTVMAAQTANTYTKSWSLKKKIDEAKSIEQLKVIDVESV